MRFIDNFSSGSRGAASAEYFLERGYAVVFLHREGSLRPFERRLPNVAAECAENVRSVGASSILGVMRVVDEDGDAMDDAPSNATDEAEKRGNASRQKSGGDPDRRAGVGEGGASPPGRRAARRARARRTRACSSTCST